MDFKLCSAVINGGGGGLGGATARRLIKLGVGVVLFDPDGEKAADLARELGERAISIQGDQSSDSERPGIREHVAFGRGVHTCAGAPLARAEVTTILNSFFDRTSDIAISETGHGKPAARQYQFEPSFIIRGLDNLHVELTPA